MKKVLALVFLITVTNFYARDIRTGVWVWDSSIANHSIVDHNKVENLIDFCQKRKIDHVNFFVDWRDAYDGISIEVNMENFLQQMHSAGLTVDVLTGNFDWMQGIDDFGYDWGKRALDHIVDYQFDHKDIPSQRFDGIHLDVEPHVHPGWMKNGDDRSSKNTFKALRFSQLSKRIYRRKFRKLNSSRRNNASYLQGYYDMLVVYQKIIDRDYHSPSIINRLSTNNLTSETNFTSRNWGVNRPNLIIDVVPWYDDEKITINLYPSGKKDAAKAIYDVTDQISLMSYRNFYSDGENGLKEWVEDALNYLDTLDPPKPTTLGLEFISGEESTVSF